MLVYLYYNSLKESKCFSEKPVSTITDSNNPSNPRSWCKNFSKAFDSIHRGKMGQILLAYCLSKETVAAIMLLYENTKVEVRSSEGDTDFFDIVDSVLQGVNNPISVYNLARLCTSNVNRSNERMALH